jgi:Flp pilus assembly protein TadD
MKFSRIFLLLLLFLAPLTPSFAGSIHSDPELDQIIIEANNLYLSAKFDEGIALLEAAEKSRQSSPAISYFIANGYWWKIFRVYIYDREAESTPYDDQFEQYLDQTVNRCELLLKRNKKDIAALFYLGNAHSLRSRLKGLRGSYFSAGRAAAKGKGYLEQVLDLDSSQYDAYFNLGMYNYLAGALPGYAKVLKTFLFLPGGDKEKGLSLLKIAGQKSTYFGDESRILLARFYADHEDLPAEAIRIVQSFHERFPENAWFHFWKASLLSDDLNNYSEAEKVYNEILEKCKLGAPTYTEELRNQTILKLARVHSKQFDPELAIQEIRLLLAEKPKTPSWIVIRAHLELGNLYDQIGMRSQAILSYKQVLSSRDFRDYHEQAHKRLDEKYNQKTADIYRANLEGRRLAREKKYAEAETALKSVLQKYPDNEQTLFALAELYYFIGSYPESSELLNRILNRKPREPKWLIPGVYVRLGMIYEARKQKDAARQSYEKALTTEFIASDDRNQAKRALKQIAQHKLPAEHGNTQ